MHGSVLESGLGEDHIHIICLTLKKLKVCIVMEMDLMNMKVGDTGGLMKFCMFV